MTCGILFENEGVGPKDEDGCRLPVGHETPHEFVSKSGAVYCWETDLECNCAHCRRNEGDYCSTYWKLIKATQGGSTNEKA